MLEVLVHDYPPADQSRLIPYGVYDVRQNTGHLHLATGCAVRPGSRFLGARLPFFAAGCAVSQITSHLRRRQEQFHERPYYRDHNQQLD